MPFTVGTVVKLKSGGPDLTVAAIDGDTVTCSWFDGARLREAKFLAGMLEEPRDLTELLERLKKEKSTATDG